MREKPSTMNENRARLRARLLIVLLHILLQCNRGWCLNFSLGASPVLGIGAVLFKPRGTSVLLSLGDGRDLVNAGGFFTDAFWTGKVGGGTQALSPPQRKSLERQQIAEFRRRYGPTLKIDRRSELLLCKSVRGEIMGCAGVEVDYISRPDGGDRVSAPLMSNVAVGRKFRRRGIAEDLVKRTEELVRKQWGYKECFLYVEKRNIAAVQLYRKMGYRKLWQVDDAKTLVPTDTGRIISQPTILLCMKKRLGGGMFSFNV